MNHCSVKDCNCEGFSKHIFKHDICVNCFHKSDMHLNISEEDIKYIQISKNDHLPCKIKENIYMGGIYAAMNLEELKKVGITHVINCALNLHKFFPKFREHRNDFIYLSLSLVDDSTCDIKSSVLECIKFIDSALKNGGKVFIHCAQGISRSGSIVVSYLMYSEHIPYDKALNIAKKGRIICNPNNNFKNQLISMRNNMEI